MYEIVYSHTELTTIAVLFALAGACAAAYAVLTIYWNLREIRRDRARANRRPGGPAPSGPVRPS